mmetsp:Transcript_11472/g.28542  ORF Transcript_11472/g.28542 Transcript_11472/m.28542 type:complete len:270 (+) Transcript_11472:1081-1890(+)
MMVWAFFSCSSCEGGPCHGSCSVNFVPCVASSVLLLTEMVPPCASTSDLTMARPRPDPSYLREEDMSLWTKGSNMSTDESFLMPTPVSCTKISTWWRCSSAPSLIMPEWVNLALLPKRLTRIWWRRVVSPIKDRKLAGTSLMSSTPGLTRGRMVLYTESETSRSATLSSLTTNRDSRMLVASRMSLMREERRYPDEMMSLTTRCILGEQPSSSSSESDRPMMPLRGVRSSCDTAARNCCCLSRLEMRSSCTRFIVEMSVSLTRMALDPV